MPTPFYHISLAKELLNHNSLSSPARKFLSTYQAAFYFGNTAPDVQVVSGQKREETHFYNIPLDHRTPAWIRMMGRHPELVEATAGDDQRAAYLAGYVCHLQADLRWLEEIFIPNFGPDGHWSTFSDRLYLHNVLRSYLDLKLIPYLPSGMDATLLAVKSRAWLPFVDDSDLATWQNFLARQLQPGARIETVEVFASRQGIGTEAFYELLESEEDMNNQVFSILPRQKLADYRQAVLVENLNFLNNRMEPDWIRMETTRRIDQT
ncbi:MAG: zinc dependent phospholipase C family protein [Anaerolineales bacterium]|nr:zinc dependent phospholipase C family protein [Anaerolineales bacterium]